MAVKDDFIPVVRIESEIKQELMKEAEREGRTLSNYVQRILNQDAEKIRIRQRAEKSSD